MVVIYGDAALCFGRDLLRYDTSLRASLCKNSSTSCDSLHFLRRGASPRNWRCRPDGCVYIVPRAVLLFALWRMAQMADVRGSGRPCGCRGEKDSGGCSKVSGRGGEG